MLHHSHIIEVITRRQITVSVIVLGLYFVFVFQYMGCFGCQTKYPNWGCHSKLESFFFHVSTDQVEHCAGLRQKQSDLLRSQQLL